MSIELIPLGYVRGGRTARSDDWGAIEAEIVLDPTQLDAEATLGLDQFSHALVVFFFDRLDAARIERGARHPRGRKDWPKVGVLAQRGSPRPNRLGVTTCEIVSAQGHIIRVRGLDALDGTPVLDVKPHMTGFAPRGDIQEPDWALDIMQAYWAK